MEKHKRQAIWAIGEGVANLVLSVVLAHFYGMYGVAVGTLIPSLFVQWVFWPGYISNLVGLSRYEVVFQVWGPLDTACPFHLTIVTYAIERFFPAHNLGVFFLQVAAALSIFMGTVALVFRSFVRSQILPKVRSWQAMSAKS